MYLIFSATLYISPTPEVTALFAEVAGSCPSLAVLQLPLPEQTNGSEFLACYEVPGYNAAQWLQPWVKALSITSSLQELRIYLPGMVVTQCLTVLQAVADNNTLKRMVLQVVPLILLCEGGDSSLMALYLIIQSLNLGDRVSVKHLLVTPQNAVRMWALPELCSLKFECPRVDFSVRQDPDFLRASCEALTRRGTSTSIRFCCRLMPEPAFVAVLHWVALSTALTHLEIVACEDAGKTSSCPHCANMYTLVVWALSQNANIASVSFVRVKVQFTHLRQLLDSARTHRNLVGFNVAPTCWDVDTCIPHPSNAGDAESYVAALRELQDMMHKNAARIRVAARFVLGEDTRKGARLIERLHEHPRLLELVREGACVADDEAQAMARAAMKKVQECSLDDYFRLTGVVKNKVERLDPDSTEVHLVKLPADVLLRVRQYLNITDVAVPRGVVDR
ncbi:uncharacterized protein [Dermacentor albipictus]|uniref:uncharacterized protein n=1 Tax=Dermacentor albipictus TaxID=60249 RepID=UPI0038FC25D7